MVENKLMGIGANILHFYQVTNDLNSLYDKNYDAHPSLKTDMETPETWWNTLSRDERHDIGAFAIHMRLMTGGCTWPEHLDYKAQPKRKQYIIRCCFSQRNNNWVAFPLSYY